jgi:hypothetical protein
MSRRRSGSDERACIATANDLAVATRALPSTMGVAGFGGLGEHSDVPRGEWIMI